MTRAIPSTYAKVTLRNGKSYSAVVMPFATPAEADIRIRNMRPDEVVSFDRRRHVRDGGAPIWDRESERWLDHIAVEHEWIDVPASEIESVSEAL